MAQNTVPKVCRKKKLCTIRYLEPTFRRTAPEIFFFTPFWLAIFGLARSGGGGGPDPLLPPPMPFQGSQPALVRGHQCATLDAGQRGENAALWHRRFSSRSQPARATEQRSSERRGPPDNSSGGAVTRNECRLRRLTTTRGAPLPRLRTLLWNTDTHREQHQQVCRVRKIGKGRRPTSALLGRSTVG